MILIFYFMAHILGYDIWYYFIHICLHNIRLYRFHKYHHLINYRDLTFADAFTGNMIEYPIQTLGIFIPNIVMEYHFRVILCAYLFITIRTYMQHDYRCIWLVGNHHLIHHKHPKYNFGERWIDKICGTLHETTV